MEWKHISEKRGTIEKKEKKQQHRANSFFKIRTISTEQIEDKQKIEEKWHNQHKS